MENLKKLAGIKAAEFVQSGMIVGLGTGSTAYYFVEELINHSSYKFDEKSKEMDIHLESNLFNHPKIQGKCL